MNVLRDHKEFYHFSHDLVIDGSDIFYSKVPEEEPSQQFQVQLPYPVQSPLIRVDETKLKKFLNNCDNVHKQACAEFKKHRDQICAQNFKKYALLPRFMESYIDRSTSNTYSDYGFNLQYSQGVLEKFYNGNTTCLVRPNAENNLLISQLEHPKEQIVLEWSDSDEILDIQRIHSETVNNFLIRGKKTLHLTEIDSDLSVEINLKLNCEAGYMDTALNHVNETKLALMDSKFKMKIFDIHSKQVCSTYSLEDMELDPRSRFAKFDFLTEDMLIVITDKEIRVLDTRSKNLIQIIDIKLENCDMLLNLNLYKCKGYLSDAVYLTSKHSFFIYDIRTTSVDDFINHNLKSAPCFINSFQDEHCHKLVTLHSQSPKDKAIFGPDTPYSIPLHLTNLEDTYNKCRSLKSVPVIPNIRKIINYPVTGVQILSSNSNISIYYTNMFGELFRQDLYNNYNSDEAIVERMCEWLEELDEKNDENLNVIQMANADAAFDFEYELNDFDIFDQYESNNRINEFLQDERFDYTKWNAAAFLEIWGQEYEDDVANLLQSEPVSSKVEEWIDKTEFTVDIG